MSMIEAQGWGPPGTWSGHPQDCDCGCRDIGWGNVRDCWRQVAELKAIIRQVVDGMNLNRGVTDGSDIKAGEIGEYIEHAVAVTFPAATANTQQVQAGVLPPGDWNLWAAFNPNNYTTGITFNLSPVPTGLSNDMRGMVQDNPGAGTGATEGSIVIATPARALIQVPTLLNFSLTSNPWNVATSVATGGSFTFGARRMR